MRDAQKHAADAESWRVGSWLSSLSSARWQSSFRSQFRLSRVTCRTTRGCCKCQVIDKLFALSNPVHCSSTSLERTISVLGLVNMQEQIGYEIKDTRASCSEPSRHVLQSYRSTVCTPSVVCRYASHSLPSLPRLYPPLTSADTLEAPETFLQQCLKISV